MLMPNDDHKRFAEKIRSERSERSLRTIVPVAILTCEPR